MTICNTQFVWLSRAARVCVIRVIYKTPGVSGVRVSEYLAGPDGVHGLTKFDRTDAVLARDLEAVALAQATRELENPADSNERAGSHENGAT